MWPYQVVAEQQLQAEGNWPNEKRKPPGWLLDKLADEKMSGGYSRKRNPVCPTCRVQKSISGECNC